MGFLFTEREEKDFYFLGRSPCVKIKSRGMNFSYFPVPRGPGGCDNSPNENDRRTASTESRRSREQVFCTQTSGPGEQDDPEG